MFLVILSVFSLLIRLQYCKDYFIDSFLGNNASLLHVDCCSIFSINSEGKNAFRKAWFYSKEKEKKNTYLAFSSLEIGPWKLEPE